MDEQGEQTTRSGAENPRRTHRRSVASDARDQRSQSGPRLRPRSGQEACRSDCGAQGEVGLMGGSEIHFYSQIGSDFSESDITSLILYFTHSLYCLIDSEYYFSSDISQPDRI